MQNKVTFYEFNSLNKNEKAEALCEHGIYLCERPDIAFRIVLYQLSNFYVEVKWDMRNNVITEFQLFITTKLLEPYLEQIDISYLIAA